MGLMEVININTKKTSLIQHIFLAIHYNNLYHKCGNFLILHTFRSVHLHILRKLCNFVKDVFAKKNINKIIYLSEIV